MSRLQQLFANKKKNVLSVYCTAGFPRLDSTIEVIRLLADNGADLIEIGMPYSDPLADGPVIQHSSTVALQNGMTMTRLFDQLRDLRTASSSKAKEIPVLLMGYMNPIMQYGFEKFCRDAAVVGIDGLILPDLPMHEFETEYGSFIKKYNLDFVFLVTPETSADRVKKLDALSTGFLYAVSSSSTTGADKNMEGLAAYVKRLKEMQLENPLLVGFGIRDKKSFDEACRYADGAIIGTAFVRAVEQDGVLESSIKTFMRSILER